MGAVHLQRLALQIADRLRGRQAERVVPVGELTALLADLEERELYDPERRPAHGRIELQERDHGLSQDAENAGDDRRGAGAEDDEIARRRRRALDQGALLRVAEELHDRPA